METFTPEQARFITQQLQLPAQSWDALLIMAKKVLDHAAADYFLNLPISELTAAMIVRLATLSHDKQDALMTDGDWLATALNEECREMFDFPLPEPVALRFISRLQRTLN